MRCRLRAASSFPHTGFPLRLWKQLGKACGQAAATAFASGTCYALRNNCAAFFRVNHSVGAAVFHSRCAPLLYKPVDNTDSPFADNHLARHADVLPSSRCLIAKFSTAIVDCHR
jgi:hypothetical protein